MQTTEVTQAQWEAVMGNNPSKFKGENHPVEQVSWDDFQEFLKKVNEKMSTMSGVEGQGALKADLPTEGEWENACRAGRPSGRASPELAEAGSTGRWCFGEEETKLGEYAWYDENSGGKTHPVGQKKPNAWGLYDMHGNVWEWCKDWYGECGGGVVDPRGPSTGTHRLVRGGGWNGYDRDARCASRSRSGPALRGSDVGGRVVLRKSR
ncbi:MAG: hypothetical protein A2Z34_10110 [Planctomycetes bacterium RBG_16_59_8]|nr:MAG: hypothetical protein A2Z34_10110 [Planctomycetes bacterium RBG_16_59_8]